MALKTDETKTQSKFQIYSTKILDSLDALVNGGCIYQHQADATKAIVKTFDSYNPYSGEQNIAMVVLPTGTGKSGIAVLAAYAVAASRVLVITPSEAITKQLFTDFCGGEEKDNIPFLIKYRIIRPDVEKNWLPTGIKVLKTSDLRNYRNQSNSIIVTNAHKFGEVDETKRGVPINEFPNDFFDLVIVDEAHHYPARTWSKIVHYFETSKIIFLTATPYRGGEHILNGRECFRLSPEVAIERGIIRNKRFIEVEGKDIELIHTIHKTLNEHDEQDPDFKFPVENPTYKHQAMVLCQSIKSYNSANAFIKLYDEIFPGECEVYHAGCGYQVLGNFKKGHIRVLVVIGRLLEGFDHKPVSVVAIYRNVHISSQVMFTQFVGRAVRKIRRDDPVTATVISLARFNQRPNFDAMDTNADVDPVDED